MSNKLFLELYIVFLGLLIGLMWILAFTADPKEADMETFFLISSVFTVFFFVAIYIVNQTIKDIDYNEEKKKQLDHFENPLNQ